MQAVLAMRSRRRRLTTLSRLSPFESTSNRSSWHCRVIVKISGHWLTMLRRRISQQKRTAGASFLCLTTLSRLSPFESTSNRSDWHCRVILRISVHWLTMLRRRISQQERKAGASILCRPTLHMYIVLRQLEQILCIFPLTSTCFIVLLKGVTERQIVSVGGGWGW